MFFCLDGFDVVEPMKDFLKNLGNRETWNKDTTYVNFIWRIQYNLSGDENTGQKQCAMFNKKIKN